MSDQRFLEAAEIAQMTEVSHMRGGRALGWSVDRAEGRFGLYS